MADSWVEDSEKKSYHYEDTPDKERGPRNPPREVRRQSGSGCLHEFKFSVVEGEPYHERNNPNKEECEYDIPTIFSHSFQRYVPSPFNRVFRLDTQGSCRT